MGAPEGNLRREPAYSSSFNRRSMPCLFCSFVRSDPMKIATTPAFAAAALASAAFAQGKGVERLHILECGQGHTGDMSRWTPGQNVNVPKDIVDNCYLIKHAQGYFLWDTG